MCWWWQHRCMHRSSVAACVAGAPDVQGAAAGASAVLCGRQQRNLCCMHVWVGEVCCWAGQVELRYILGCHLVEVLVIAMLAAEGFVYRLWCVCSARIQTLRELLSSGTGGELEWWLPHRFWTGWSEGCGLGEWMVDQAECCCAASVAATTVLVLCLWYACCQLPSCWAAQREHQALWRRGFRATCVWVLVIPLRWGRAAAGQVCSWLVHGTALQRPPQAAAEHRGPLIGMY